ncbi:MAG: hypothetical protein HXY43_03425 [Fischerella sp.]|jgi:hypothetical protein|uniref:hypothetical protein n=1 Tax=Fischerella sp. TaxID=1191 RepID=UPI00182241B7|nr:hypothetical protein [Fischerella sp.]NWF58376.1 hypothetical protein [Fischerella sp.]
MSSLEGEDFNHNFTDSMPGSLVQSTNKPAFSNNLSEISSLEKVRDILFGGQMRELEKKFTRIEERLVKECTNLRDETKKRLDYLENYIKNEVEALTEQIKSEQSKRDEAVKALSEDQKNINISLEKKLTQIDEQTSIKGRELREQILNQSQSLQDDIRQKYEEILALLQREAQELRTEKTDRSTLAAMFTELAIRLNSKQ